MTKKYLYLSVKEMLLEETKQMNPDKRIQSRNTLMKKYHVTRTTVDRAISEMVGEGYLYSINGSGTYVAKRDLPVQYDKGQIHSIGLVIPNILSHDYPEIVRGVEDIADQNGYNVIICNTDNEADKQQRHIKKLIDSRVMGIAIVPIINDIEVESFKLLKKENIPFVFCNRGIEGIQAPMVVDNNFYGAYIATRYLIQTGHKNIAFLSRPMYSIIKERLQGYISALTENNIDYNEDMVAIESYDTYKKEDNYGFNQFTELIRKNAFIDAVVCSNDTIAYNAIKAVEALSKAVPKDIAVISFDNTALCEMSPIKISAVNFKKYNTGCISAKLLIDIINNNSNKEVSEKVITSIPGLVIRESC